MPIRAVVDTSALFGTNHRADLQQLAETGIYTAIWSPWIVAELNRVLTWHWFTQVAPNDVSDKSRVRCAQAAKTLMALLTPVFATVDPKPPYPAAWQGLTDPWDVPIWAAAKIGGAEYAVSENMHDFPPAGDDGRHVFGGVEYLTVDAFVAMFTGDVGELRDEGFRLSSLFPGGILPDISELHEQRE